MIDQKYYGLVYSFLMSLLMSCIMSFGIGVFNTGLVGDVVNVWLKSWLLSFTIAFPVVVIVSPLIQKITGLVLKWVRVT